MLGVLTNFSFEVINGKVCLRRYLGEEKKVVVPAEYDDKPVEIIGDKAFITSKSVKEIVLPDTVNKIQDRAFGFCEYLESINIPESITEINEGVFICCHRLKSIELPENIEIIGANAFYDCKSLKSITFPKNLKEISANAFWNCKSLKSITFTENITKIGLYAFKSCNKLKEINIPENIERVDDYAFSDCEKVEKITIANKKAKIGKGAFAYLPNLKEFDFEVFKGLKNIEQVDYLEKNINDWENYEYKNEMHSYLKRSSAFRKKLFLGNNVTIINFLLQQNFKIKLADINAYIENTIKYEETEITTIYLNYKNDNFTTEEVEALNEENELVDIGLEYPTLKQLKEKWVCSVVSGGLRISGYKGNNETEIIPKQIKDGTLIVAVRGANTNSYDGIKKLIIEAEITSIPDKAFYNCIDLREIVLPNTITYVGKSAFAYSSITSIELPDGVETINNGAFHCCFELEEIVIPHSVENINSHMSNPTFGSCGKLREIKIPKTTKVGKSAFFNCNVDVEYI